MHTPLTNQEQSQGFALIATILLVVLVAGLGAGLLVEATTETKTNANFRSSVQAFYVARSGLEEARARVPILSTNPLALPGSIQAVTYIVANPGVDPANPANSFYDQQYASEFAGVTPVVAPLAASFQPSGSALPYQWVRVTMKTEASSSQDINRDGTLDNTTPVYWDGASQNLGGAGKPVYKLTALAVLANGSRSVLQMEGSQPPPVSTDAAIASQDDVRLQGNFTVSGNDYCGQTAPVYGVKTTQDIDTAGNAGATVGLTGPYPNTTGTYEYAPASYDINVLINSLKEYATPIQLVDPTVTYSSSTNSYSGSNATLGVPPPAPPPPDSVGNPTAITYSSASLSLSSNNSQGAGILIVDGDLNVNGGFYYYGLIVVRGIVSFTGGGSNSVNIHGSIISGSSFTNSTNVGGGVNVQYDSCAIKNPFDAIPLKVLAFREIINQ